MRPVGCRFMYILCVGDEHLKFCGGVSKRSVAPVGRPGDRSCVQWSSLVCSCATMCISIAAATVVIWFCETSALAGAAMVLSAAAHCSSCWFVAVIVLRMATQTHAVLP